jgi:hypothetical protein
MDISAERLLQLLGEEHAKAVVLQEENSRLREQITQLKSKVDKVEKKQ